MPADGRIVHLPGAVGDLIRAAAERTYPREACGFLVGLEVDDGVRVESARPAPNRATRHDRFTIDAADVWRALRAARDEGRQLVGVYHSHPDGCARPSPIDRQEAWGDFVWLIVPCARGVAGDPGCWEWLDPDFRRLPMRWT